MKQPAWQVPKLHILPPPQLMPSSLLDQSDVEDVGLQILHWLPWAVVPLSTSALSIQHPLRQVPELHILPLPTLPQLVPFPLTVQSLVEEEVWHVWQAFAGLGAPLA
jgi:hypothetical protein